MKRGIFYIAQGRTDADPRSKISVFNPCLKWERNIYLEGFEGAESFVVYRLALDKKGNIYVSGIHFPGVLILNNQGKFLDMMSPEEGDKKVKLNNVTIDRNGRIYLLSEEDSRIFVYDEDKKFLFKFGEKGGSSGKLSRPRAIAIDSRSGNLYVVDYMRHTVNIYDKNGKYFSEFGGLGWERGGFSTRRISRLILREE